MMTMLKSIETWYAVARRLAARGPTLPAIQESTGTFVRLVLSPIVLISSLNAAEATTPPAPYSGVKSIHIVVELRNGTDSRRVPSEFEMAGMIKEVLESGLTPPPAGDEWPTIPQRPIVIETTENFSADGAKLLVYVRCTVERLQVPGALGDVTLLTFAGGADKVDRVGDMYSFTGWLDNAFLVTAIAIPDGTEMEQAVRQRLSDLFAGSIWMLRHAPP